jgi:hypothetical protein
MVVLLSSVCWRDDFSRLAICVRSCLTSVCRAESASSARFVFEIVCDAVMLIFSCCAPIFGCRFRNSVERWPLLHVHAPSLGLYWSFVRAIVLLVCCL